MKLVYAKAGMKTAKILAERLGIEAVEDISSYDKVILWGKSLVSNRRFISVGNRAYAIANTANKLAMRENLMSLSPKWGAALFPLLEDFPVYLRKKSHSQGRGLKFVENFKTFIDLWDSFDYWIKAITDPDRVEYRIHMGFVGGKRYFVYRQKKVFENGEPSERELLVRNHKNGWRFWTMKTAPTVVMQKSAKAIRKLGLCHGAVDVVYTPKDNDAYVLEVNSSPGLTFKPLIDQYVEFFTYRIENCVEEFDSAAEHVAEEESLQEDIYLD